MKATNLGFAFGDETRLVFGERVRLAFFSDEFLLFFALFIVFKHFDLIGIAQVVAVASVHVRHLKSS